MRTEAQVMTESGQLYMKKLCRHFGHKVPVTIQGEQGVIEFPFGRCRLLAKPDQLQLLVEVNGEDEVGTAERVVGDHLKRMAPKEPLQVEWKRIVA